MLNQYIVLYQNRKLALAYVSSHPEFDGHIIVSVSPLERKGKWEDDSLQLKLASPLHDIFPISKSEIDAVIDVISQVGIEPGKVEIKKVNTL